MSIEIVAKKEKKWQNRSDFAAAPAAVFCKFSLGLDDTRYVCIRYRQLMKNRRTPPPSPKQNKHKKNTGHFGGDCMVVISFTLFAN